ncbi:MAG: hypothetical protein IJO92_03575 [Clostridia bacterium]|nr:hypothetical protein [Clostridia bacterium]
MEFCQTNKEVQEYIRPILQKKKDCKLKKIFSNEYHKLKEGGIWEVEDTLFLLFEDDTCMEIGGFIFGQVYFDDDALLPDDEEDCFDFFNTTQGRYCEATAHKDETITFQMNYGAVKGISGLETNGVLDLLIIETEGGEIRIHPKSSRYCTMEVWSPTAIITSEEETAEYDLVFSDLDEDVHIFFFVNSGELPPFELDATMSFVTDLYDYKWRLFLSKDEFFEFSEQIKDLELELTDRVEFKFWAMIMDDIKKHGFEDFDYSEQGELTLTVQRKGNQFLVNFCDGTQTPPMNIEFLSKWD